MGPNPIFARHPYYPTKCELCGWVGSSEQCRVYSNGDDADVGCPACDQIFLCDEIETEELNAAVVAQARAEGERAGRIAMREEAAQTAEGGSKSFDFQAAYADCRDDDAGFHNGRLSAADAIRALKVEGEPP